MKLKTILHTGRRGSYYALIRLTLNSDGVTVNAVDETGIWTAVLEVDERLGHRMRDDKIAYFWGRVRGGDVEIYDREFAGADRWGKDDV